MPISQLLWKHCTKFLFSQVYNCLYVSRMRRSASAYTSACKTFERRGAKRCAAETLTSTVKGQRGPGIWRSRVCDAPCPQRTRSCARRKCYWARCVHAALRPGHTPILLSPRVPPRGRPKRRSGRTVWRALPRCECRPDSDLSPSPWRRRVRPPGGRGSLRTSA